MVLPVQGTVRAGWGEVDNPKKIYGADISAEPGKGEVLTRCLLSCCSRSGGGSKPGAVEAGGGSSRCVRCRVAALGPHSPILPLFKENAED